MKLSDFVAEHIANLGVTTVFSVSGGASLHLIHSVVEHPALENVCPQHEQAAAMAADGYARSSGNLGVAIATSGPGATNLITGICCSYYDSIPVLCITGQVSTFRQTGRTGVRQIGFQETPIVHICEKITKYAVSITSPEQIKFELEKACFLAAQGRPGPVLIDIPDDLQRAEIEPEKLEGFSPPSPQKSRSASSFEQLKERLECLLEESCRPVAIIGWGVNLSKTEEQTRDLLSRLGIPTVSTWGASDVFTSDDDLYLGNFGTHGLRHANFAVQNADLILSLGSRLDTKATGSPVTSFARGAKKIMVEIDNHEIQKFESFDLRIDCPINMGLQEFYSQLELRPSMNESALHDWHQTLGNWRRELDAIDETHRMQGDQVNPYFFTKSLVSELPGAAKIFVDTGCGLAWLMQSQGFKKGQRVFHDFNNTAMGWALPAAIGAYFDEKPESLCCLVGDGSFMMTLFELTTAMHHDVPIKIFVLNNNGYAMIRQTQDQWLGSNYYASSPKGGVSFPSLQDIAKAFEFDYVEIGDDKNVRSKIGEIVTSANKTICEVLISPKARVIPQVKFPNANEDMEPLLPRDTFEKFMIIPPHS
jgi:acetolactate synthase-1/2/3 large subunit